MILDELREHYNWDEMPRTCGDDPSWSQIVEYPPLNAPHLRG